ncbi:hypothetical protein EB093_07690, partial [bacterium]|nr:hypothetical protein [bacterium]
MPTTSDNKLDLLYKKFIGIPLSNPSGAAASEAAGSSKSKIIPSLQIFSQSIPSTAPSDLSNVTFTPANSGGTKQISASNTHIAKYTQLGLSEVQPQISYRYANPSVSTNLTSPAIPGNYDIAGSTYAITLYGSDGTTVINPSTYPWVFDTDSGYVTFIDPASLLPISLAPPKITFWRYEGTFGLSSGDLSSNGNLFIAYDTSLNSRLVVGSDVTVNKRLFIGGDASLNGNLTIGKDLTINGRLNVHNYTNQNIINTTTTNYTLIVSEDLSLNGRFVVSGDSSMNGNLYIAGTLSAANFAANSIPSSAIIGGVGSGGSGSSSGAVTGDLSSNGNLFIAYDTSLNSRLVVGSDVTVNKRLFILGDVSMNGSLYVADNITTVTQDISDNSTKVATTAFVKNVLDASFSNYYAKSDIDSSLNLKAPIASPTFTGIATIPIANIDNLTTSADANINGNLIVNNGYLRIQNLPIGLNNIGSSISIGIDALINNTGSNNIAIGKNSSSGMISGKQNIAIGVNAMQLNVNGNNNIALGSYSLNNNSHGHNNVAIGINSGDMDISGNNNTYLGSDTNVDNNDNVYSFSTAIGSESVITASNQIMLGRLIGTEHVVIPGDLSLNLGMSVGGDSSMNGNLYVSGSITSLTQNISDNSTKVATTAFVKNVLDASLGNLSNYYTKSVIDASLNEYYTKSTIDASLGNYYTKSVIDASLGEYYTKSVIDASLGEYYTKSVIDASLGEYYTKSAVDSSFNLKAPIDSPTFTGIATIPTVNITNLNTVGDSSLNGNVTISKDLTINGILNVKNYTNQNIINTTTTNYQLIVSEDLSLNGRLIVSSDVSMNNNLFVNGNITTQTLPTSDNSTKVATTEFVKNQNYSTISYVDSSLNNLKTYVDNSLNLKSSITYVDSSLNTLQTYTDSSLNLKSSITYV